MTRVLVGDCRTVLPTLPAESAQCVVTSPPYYAQRDYGVPGQIGHEPSVEAYVAALVAVLHAVRRVLRPDGVLWLSLGDGYAGGTPRTRSPLPPKSLLGVPWRVALALQADGWLLRSDVVWAKPNPMPESVRDRPVRAHEYIFLLARRGAYYYDAEAIRTPSRALPARPRSADRTPAWRDKQAGHGRRYAGFNARWSAAAADRTWAARRDVWTIAPAQSSAPHYAVMPEEVARLCVLAGSRPGDLVLDPFCGVGTTGAVAVRYGRHFLGIDLHAEYAARAERRLALAARPLLETLDDLSGSG